MKSIISWIKYLFFSKMYKVLIQLFLLNKTGFKWTCRMSADVLSGNGVILYCRRKHLIQEVTFPPKVRYFLHVFRLCWLVCQLRVSVLPSIHFNGLKGSQVKRLNNVLVTQISGRVIYGEVLQILLVLSVKGSKSPCWAKRDPVYFQIKKKY